MLATCNSGDGVDVSSIGKEEFRHNSGHRLSIKRGAPRGGGWSNRVSDVHEWTRGFGRKCFEILIDVPSQVLPQFSFLLSSQFHLQHVRISYYYEAWENIGRHIVPSFGSTRTLMLNTLGWLRRLGLLFDVQRSDLHLRQHTIKYVQATPGRTPALHTVAVHAPHGSSLCPGFVKPRVGDRFFAGIHILHDPAMEARGESTPPSTVVVVWGVRPCRDSLPTFGMESRSALPFSYQSSADHDCLL